MLPPSSSSSSAFRLKDRFNRGHQHQIHASNRSKAPAQRMPATPNESRKQQQTVLQRHLQCGVISAEDSNPRGNTRGEKHPSKKLQSLLLPIVLSATLYHAHLLPLSAAATRAAHIHVETKIKKKVRKEKSPRTSFRPNNLRGMPQQARA